MGQSSLKQIKYISSFAPKTTQEDVQAILETSRRNNQNSDISGILMVSDQTFFQILEGPEGDVDQVWDRIRGDHRHDNICVLTDGALRERSFGRWRMQHLLSFHEDEALNGVGKVLDSAATQCRALMDLGRTDTEEKVTFLLENARLQELESLLTGIGVLAYRASQEQST